MAKRVRVIATHDWRGSVQTSLHKYESQLVLFSKKLSRQKILGLPLLNEGQKVFKINVWRNHSFETLIPLIDPYAKFGRWDAHFIFGGYDDSLMFNEWRLADVELLWLDTTRYPLEQDFGLWSSWLCERLKTLRSYSSAPILLATWAPNDEQNAELQILVNSLSDIYYLDVKKITRDAGIELIDMRTASLAGTPIGREAQLLIARELACHSLPSMMLPPIKAIVVDLDNTLHRGILGEDGITGVELTESHRSLQLYLKSLQERGIFICLLSRNEYEDVKLLFLHRQDYPLRWDDFSAVEVSWDDKSLGLQRICNVLRIAPDAVLFVDDNLGELVNVVSVFPSAHTVYAQDDAGLTQQSIMYYPALWRWRAGKDDDKRIKDLKANNEREVLSNTSVNLKEYFSSLQVKVHYRNDPRDQLDRVAELCNKTNQFNLAMRRFKLSEIAEKVEDVTACVATVELSDRFSDSGVIATLVAVRREERLVVNEICISCRAMGRKLENDIILGALLNMPIFNGCSEVAFVVIKGPRNLPAIEWLTVLMNFNSDIESGTYIVKASVIENYSMTEGINFIKE